MRLRCSLRWKAKPSSGGGRHRAASTRVNPLLGLEGSWTRASTRRLKGTPAQAAGLRAKKYVRAATYIQKASACGRNKRWQGACCRAPTHACQLRQRDCGKNNKCVQPLRVHKTNGVREHVHVWLGADSCWGGVRVIAITQAGACM